MSRKLLFFLATAAVFRAYPGLAHPGIEEHNKLEVHAQVNGQEDESFRSGRSDLDKGDWNSAIAAFNTSIAKKSTASDAALFWKAYAQNRSGRRQDALSTIASLRRQYGGSRWLQDAQALELEINTQAGTPPAAASEQNDELKLMALNSLIYMKPKEAFPALEHILKSSNSPRLRERALFVLTQSPLPEARQLLLATARGSASPDLQHAAIRYLGMMGNDSSRNDLASLYESTSDVALKKSILQSFMVSGSRSFLLKIAKDKSNPELQRDAIRQLALTGDQAELWQLYQSEKSIEIKKQILQFMFVSGNSERLAEVTGNESDPQLRIAAIKSLGLMGSNGRTDLLVSTYRSDQNRDVRSAILNALFLQQNGRALVDLARSERDPAMKQEIVKKMALVHSKETRDYMMEILK